MPLTTIDGMLCCPLEEFQQLCCYLGLQSLTSHPRYKSEHQAERELGAQTRNIYREGYGASYSPLTYVPDEWFIREVIKGVQQSAITGVKAKIGEEEVDGKVCTGAEMESNNPLSHLADVSLIGPASLGGKIVRELCYRLYVEVQKDKRAQRYAPHEQLDQRVLQPDPPAENK